MDVGKLNIPENSGVYLMKKKNKIIYVGKAKNLKKRVLSYFNKYHDDEKTKELVSNVENIEFIITNSEIDALLLENNLIKKYRPKYNILLKDEKTYPYIVVTKEKFPKIKMIRTTKALEHKNNEYFGPYPFVAKGLINFLSNTFKVRDCNRDMSKIYKRPCLRFYMKTCDAPCVNKNIESEYKDGVSSIREILNKNIDKLIVDFTNKMKEFSEKMDFEKAINYREKIKLLKNINNNQIIENNKELDEDVFVFQEVNNKIFICVLNIRNAKIIGKNSTIIDLSGKIFDDLIETIFISYYTKYPLVKNIIIDQNNENKMKNILSALEKYADHKINFFFPKIKSRKKDLIDMAYINLAKDIENYYFKKEVIENGMKEIYETLNLKRFPIKIECFDISNIQGKDAVASMSVSIEGRASKKNYRKFKIRCKDTPDDFSMMREVIERRYSKLEKNEFPDVILIDGGLGQINAAGEILQKLGKLDYCDLLSIAKREEEIFKYGESKSYRFSMDSEAIKIFQRVRDEAHRFGITYHRKLRRKRIISSELDNINGIGEVRRVKLLKKFGSVKKIKEASVEDIAEIVPFNLAMLIKKKLNEK